jgi:hypothetical protein
MILFTTVCEEEMYSVVFTSRGYNMYVMMIDSAYIRSEMVEARMRIKSSEWPINNNAVCVPSMHLCVV